MNATPVFTEQDFRQIYDLVYRRFGIYLSPQKRSLVFSRLLHLVRVHGFKSFAEYIRYVQNDSSGRALMALADYISTNHTYFNRENSHFEFLRHTAIPFWLDKLQQTHPKEKMRVWSAGCSSGEEAYQLAMLFHEMLGGIFARQQAAVLATDISRSMLKKAEKGIYADENVKRLPMNLIQKYFVRLNENQWQVKPFLKEMILFRRQNLVEPVYPFKRKFHTILCRNVMIYFDKKTREQVVEKFARYLENGGFLVLGLAEVLPIKNSYFEYVQPAVYMRK